MKRLRSAEADVIGVNCLDGDSTVALFAQLLGPDSNFKAENPDAGPFAAFPSAGLPQNHAGRLDYPLTPEVFAATGLALAGQGVRLIGGCCGTGARHVAALAKALQGNVGSR